LLQLSTVDEAAEVSLDESGVSEPVFGLRSGLVKHRLEMLMHDAVKQRLPRLPRPVARLQRRACSSNVLFEPDRR
jgi:hypothetical protein